MLRYWRVSDKALLYIFNYGWNVCYGCFCITARTRDIIRFFPHIFMNFSQKNTLWRAQRTIYSNLFSNLVSRTRLPANEEASYQCPLRG